MAEAFNFQQAQLIDDNDWEDEQRSFDFHHPAACLHSFLTHPSAELTNYPQTS